MWGRREEKEEVMKGANEDTGALKRSIEEGRKVEEG